MNITEKIRCFPSNSSSECISAKSNADLGVTQSQVTLEVRGSKAHCDEVNMSGKHVERKDFVKGHKEGLTQVPSQQEQEFQTVETSEKSPGAAAQMDTKRRVAVCDATDEAKKSRCHMRVIMKKF